MVILFIEHFYNSALRPCVRRNFPNFSFSRVSEKFGCRSSEIFRKKTEFLNSQNFRKKVRKFWKQGFPNVQKFRKLFFFPKFLKITKNDVNNSNFGNREKLVPTRKPTRKFG